MTNLMGRVEGRNGQVVNARWIGVGGLYSPAGGMITTGEDMTKYMLFLLRKGVAGGRQLLSENRVQDMHTPQLPEKSIWTAVINPLTRDPKYCLGWIAHEYEGRKIVEHGGANFGSSVVALMPEAGVGVFISSGATYSTDSDRMISALKFTAFDLALGLQSRDWIKVLGF